MEEPHPHGEGAADIHVAPLSRDFSTGRRGLGGGAVVQPGDELTLPWEQHDGQHDGLAGVGVPRFVEVDAIADEVGRALRVLEQRAVQQGRDPP